MKIAFNPSTVAALTTPPNNKDITFDLRGQNIFARGVKFCGTDTNTWRDIKINNVSIGSHTLDLRNGSNTTLTNTNGVVTINSTWRPVVDNLTSNSATSSLSANQGRVLAGLINGKSDLDHNHDGRYLKLTGGTLTGNLVGTSAIFSGRFYGNGNDEGIIIKPSSNGYAGLILGAHDGERSIFYFVKNKPFWRYSHGSDNLDIIHPKKSGTIALISDIPNKNSWNYDDRYLKLTGGTMSGQISSNYSVGTYIAGCTNAILKATADGYNSLICAPIKSGNVCISAWTAEDNLNFGYAKKGKTENSFDTRMYWDAPNNNLHAAAFTGHLYGTADNAVNSDTTDGVHLEWSGKLGVNDYTWLAGWTNDGKKIKAVNKNQFATSGHTHDGRYVYNYGGTAANGQTLNQNALFMTTNSGITGDWWHILQAARNDEYRWNSQIAFPTQNRNGMYYRSGLDNNTKWGSWVKLLDVNNYSSTLDSRYYTETEVNSLLDAKLNRQNLSYGTWNPRGYHLAADYNYNGGDLSISESGGSIHVSVDGYFWQNGGRYRVLDTSDVAGLKGDLTVHQYLSNTDTTWWPLIWGGSSHHNVSDSTGAVYKSHDVLSWQTSSQTLYATHLRTTYIDLENSRGIFQVTPKGTSPYKGIRLPDLQSNGIGMFSKIGSGDGADEGGIIISADTSVIYNSFNTGWGLTIRDKDKGQMDISGDGTIAFGVRQDYRAYSLGGFEKSGSNNSYVLLGGGGHKLESSLNVASATNAYHLRINSANTWSTWYWAGQSGQPSWLWGSNDRTNMYVWNPSNFNVNTAQYLRSLGNQNCQTGRTQAYGDVYSYNTYENNTGSPTAYTSVIGFGRGIGGTVEIAGGWCNTNLYWRSLRDCCEDWYSWRTVLDSNNYTDFIGNYYWANVKISTSSSTTTSPTVSNLTATNSIKMGNILLEYTDEINNITNDGSLNLNCRNSGNVSLCAGGGKVGIGTRYPTHELYVMGYTQTKGFGINPYYLSNSGSLPTISPGDGYTYRCLEIGSPTKISCIIADKTYLPRSMRGVLLNFKEGFDGQLVLLKDLQNYGSGNGYFWVMPSRCKIIRAEGSSILIDQNQISNTYDDGHSRFFIYSSKYSAWIEFLCSNFI